MDNKIIIGVDHGNRFIKSSEGIYSSGYVESLTVPPVTENLCITTANTIQSEGIELNTVMIKQ